MISEKTSWCWPLVQCIVHEVTAGLKPADSLSCFSLPLWRQVVNSCGAKLLFHSMPCTILSQFILKMNLVCTGGIKSIFPRGSFPASTNNHLLSRSHLQFIVVGQPCVDVGGRKSEHLERSQADTERAGIVPTIIIMDWICIAPFWGTQIASQ